MSSFLRKVRLWVSRRRKEEELREELQFHLESEADERQADGLTADEAKWAARRDLGNAALLREDTRALWTWTLVEQLAQDLRYALRILVRNRGFTAVAGLSLALGIGSSTAIYSFMDSILLRSLPVPDPSSLVVMKWRSKPFPFGSRAAAGGSEFVMHSVDGSVYGEGAGTIASIFPFPAFERLQYASPRVLINLFAYHPAGDVNVMVNGKAELAQGQFVSGDFFRGLGVSPAAGRLILAGDDRAGAAPAAVISMGYSRRRFGDAASAAGQTILINNVAFTVTGVAPSEFFGVDPGEAPDIYLPMHARLLFDADAGDAFIAQNHYWLGMMGRLAPGVARAEAQAALEAPFAQWAASTATNDKERANLPVLHLEEGAGGLDSLRRRFSKPLYVLLGMVGLILAIACANTANLLLARASVRKREIAVRLSIGAGSFRVVRQLLTESVLLASVGGALGILIAMAGIRVLTRLLTSGQERLILNPELNWHVLAATVGLSLLCGLLFGLAPAIQLARPGLMSTLRGAALPDPRTRARGRMPRPGQMHVLVVAQIALSLLLLVAAGLFARTLSNLQSIPLGFNRNNVLLFELNAPQAGHPEPKVAAFYAGLRRSLGEIPGVRDATMSHASLIRAGRQYPVIVKGVPARGTRILATGPEFFTTMQIPILKGREIDERDRLGSAPVAVVSDLFARTYFGEENPLGRHITVRAHSPIDLEIIGVAAAAQYGGIKRSTPPVVYIPYATMAPVEEMTFALRTDGDPLRYVSAVRAIVHEADARVPVTNVKTQAADIDQTINQEIVFARLCSAFAIVALVIAGIGLYGTLAYSVARRTREIGIRMALGARRGLVVWMVLRDVCLLAAFGLAIGVPIALGTSRFIESFLFGMKANDPRALTLAVAMLLAAVLVASYGPARRASRIDPIIALRQE